MDLNTAICIPQRIIDILRLPPLISAIPQGNNGFAKANPPSAESMAASWKSFRNIDSITLQKSPVSNRQGSLLNLKICIYFHACNKNLVSSLINN